MDQLLEPNFTPALSPQVFPIVSNWCMEDETRATKCLEHFCSDVRRESMYHQLTDAFDKETWYLVYIIIGSFVGVAFFLFVYNTERLQTHPMKLVMWLVLIDSQFQMLMSLNMYMCDWKLNNLLAYTLFFSSEPIAVYRATY